MFFPSSSYSFWFSLLLLPTLFLLLKSLLLLHILFHSPLLILFPLPLFLASACLITYAFSLLLLLILFILVLSLALTLLIPCAPLSLTPTHLISFASFSCFCSYHSLCSVMLLLILFRLLLSHVPVHIITFGSLC